MVSTRWPRSWFATGFAGAVPAAGRRVTFPDTGRLHAHEAEVDRVLKPVGLPRHPKIEYPQIWGSSDTYNG
jgi:hypothetical protein